MSSILPGTYNSRDTGGTPLRSGGSTRAGVLFRSDALHTLSAAGLEALEAGPIGVIADFRTDAERSEAPDLLPRGRTFEVLELSLLEGAMTAPAASDPEHELAAIISRLPALPELYTAMLDHSAERFAEVAGRIADTDADAAHPAVLVHCTAGKDRTGVATALLLDTAGAEREAVIADYTRSEANLSGEWIERLLVQVEPYGEALTAQVRRYATATPRGAIEAALAWLDERGGSADYLAGGGLTGAQIDRLRKRIAG